MDPLLKILLPVSDHTKDKHQEQNHFLTENMDQVNWDYKILQSAKSSQKILIL